MDGISPLERMVACGVIAIIRAGKPDGLVEAAQAILAGGVVAVEFTLNTPDALDLVGLTRRRLGQNALVGVGTVLNQEDVERSIDAGAQFVVMPVLDRPAIETANREGLPVIPGAYTPSEVLRAWDWGADLVKLFPASAGGPAYLKALRGPLPQVPLVPTGGVSLANAADYIRAGAAAVAVGGKLVDPAAIAAGAFDQLTRTAGELLGEVQRARQEVATSSPASPL